MPDERKPLQPELALEELRRYHLGDAPSVQERSQLMALILERADGSSNESPPTQRPRSTRTLARTLAGAAVAVAAALALWQQSSPGIHPEPSASMPTASASSAAAKPLPRRCLVAQGGDGLLADFEQPLAAGQTLTLPEFDQRRGEWFHMTHDREVEARNNPLVVAALGDSANNRGALHVKGTATSGWGANVGLRFTSCYDASAYEGVEFRARGPGGVFFAIQTVASVPVQYGGACSEKCWFNGGRFIVLSDSLETYRVRWRDIDTPDHQAIEKTILQVTFSIQSGTEYDFWLDDVKLFPSGQR